MKKFVFIFFSIVMCLMCSCEGSTEPLMDEGPLQRPISQTETNMIEPESISELPLSTLWPEEDARFSYILVRREQTVLSRQEHLECSFMCYEMPIMLVYDEELQRYSVANEENAEITAVNDGFEQECGSFLAKSAEFMELSMELATWHHGELGKYYNEMKTYVTQCDDSIFSVRQILHSFTYGLNTYSESGLTFSTKTGKQLDVGDFVDMEHNAFYELMFNYLSAQMQDVSFQKN